MKNIGNITLFVFFLMLISCGYQSPEEDKHPDIPLFPNHTNSKITIKDFPFVTTDIHYNEDYFFVNNEDYKLLILDRKFNKIKETNESTSLSNISKDGHVYFIRKGDKYLNLEDVYKMSPLSNFKKEKMNVLTILPREGVTVRDSLILVLKDKFEDKDSAKFNNYIDSLTNLAMEKELENTSRKINALKNNLICIFPVEEDISILKYNNKEVALYSTYGHIDEFKDILEEKSCGSLEPIWNLEKSPKSFDKVVLGNSYSGNHYVGGYTPYGYNYIQLKINNETTKFKAHNLHNEDGINILFEKNDTLILKDVKNRLYYATLKK